MSRQYQDAISRWAGVGPYYAMFPVPFADEVVRTYTDANEIVVDPFSGRGTALYSAASQGREAIGIEINPVGFVYARAKLRPATRADVDQRIEEISELAPSFLRRADALPEFFRHCFSRRVRAFLLAAREDLDWRRRRVDQTVAALLMIYLHGKEGGALSNQMRQAKAMSPQYAIRWWAKRKLRPPDLDPVEFLKSRLDWRYAKGTPELARARVYLGDSRRLLSRVRNEAEARQDSKATLLFTSPPYFAITNYHYDQWLRLWLLGGPPNALLHGNGQSGKFESRTQYEGLLKTVFKKSSKLLREDATVYVRTDSREFTLTTTTKVLKDVFPRHRMTKIERPLSGSSQTDLFGSPRAEKRSGEVDLILRKR